MVLHFGVIDAPPPPLLNHTMFELQGFESLIERFSYELVKNDAEKIGRYLFADYKMSSKIDNEKTVVFYFRSGDIFSTDINPIYSQPPLSYYVKCYEHICETMANFKVFVVYENELNPCISKFKKYLEDRGVFYIDQSASFRDDASIIASANCIVAAFSSFCDVLALMNENLDRWYAFRSIAAYEGIELSIAREFSAILQSDNIEAFRVIDEGNEYTNMGGWQNTEAQLSLMLNYPISALAIERQNRDSLVLRVA